MGQDKDLITLPVPLEEHIEVAAAFYTEFMIALGMPINDETVDTPKRIARMFSTDFSSFRKNPPQVALFNRQMYDQYIVIKDIQFSSLCEHHHLPFIGVAHVGYHPDQWLAGLSKVPRVVQHFAGRPQLQEHLTVQIADYLFEQLKPFGVMVVIEASHSCMSCRGIRDPRSRTYTSKFLGKVDKSEMLALMRGFNG